MTRVRVTSEIGPLQAVLVHTPGNELSAVTPWNRKDYLYDDIVDLEFAKREHRRMVGVLERFTDVYEVGHVLEEALEVPGARELLIKRAMNIVPSKALATTLSDVPSDQLTTMLIEGAADEAGPIGQMLNEVGFTLPPVPNLFFTRDIGIVIGDHVVIGAMRHESRWTEELLIKALFLHHPQFENAGILYDGSEERRIAFHLEGGDVHPVREDLLLLGFSSRSSAAALDHLCDLVFERTSVRDVIVVVMPGEQTAIHLDMIFTHIDHGVCVLFPPHFVGPERLAVLHRTKDKHTAREMPDFFTALAQVNFRVDPVFCGGARKSHQEREQWASGCNLFALRPGLALSYKRNEGTLEELSKAGYRVVDGVDFLTTDESIDEDEKAVITLEGSELVRGGGGPRCMTLPLRREDIG
ncbi:MAG TPA: arginine deiminase family protein [Gemmatimonadales bacterium]|jgi:arginine deiminase